MTDKLKQAIEVLKKFKEWANTPINGSSKYDLIKLFGSIDTVVAEVEKSTYTPADMEEFSYWYHRKVSVIGESELHLFGVRPFEDIISFWKKEKETTE